MIKNDAKKIEELANNFKVEELEERLEFVSCHWGNGGGTGQHQDDGSIVNCHF